MRLKPCGCDASNYERLQRSWWMRLFESRRYYHCNRCKANMFLTREDARVRPSVLPDA